MAEAFSSMLWEGIWNIIEIFDELRIVLKQF